MTTIARLRYASGELALSSYSYGTLGHDWLSDAAAELVPPGAAFHEGDDEHPHDGFYTPAGECVLSVHVEYGG